MNTRIKELRTSLNLTQQEFGNSLMLSRTTISSFESGAKIPGPKTIDYICLKYNINKVWLLDGIGEMYPSEITNSKLFNDVISSLGENNVESLEFIKDYISLSFKDKILVNQLVTRLLK